MVLRKVAGNQAFQKGFFLLFWFAALHTFKLQWIIYIAPHCWQEIVGTEMHLDDVFVWLGTRRKRFVHKTSEEIFFLFHSHCFLVLWHKRGSVFFSCIRCWDSGQVFPPLRRPLSLHLILGKRLPLLGGKFGLVEKSPVRSGQWIWRIATLPLPLPSFIHVPATSYREDQICQKPNLKRETLILLFSPAFQKIVP